MGELLLPLLVAVSVAASASLLGSFAILKRMALVGDALSHVALPGLALAMMLEVNPFIGAAVLLFVTVAGIWVIEYRSPLSLDTIVGVFFTASLAIGAIIMPEHELVEALFGDITELSPGESIVSIALSIALIVAILAIHRKLALNMVSQEMAQSIGIRNKSLEFIYLMCFATAVALGIRFVGALMMGSLVIIPAASAKNVARSLRGFLYGSVLFGVSAASTGIYVSNAWSLSPGPVFILLSTAIFVMTLLARLSIKR